MITHNFDPVFIDLVYFQIRWYSLAYIAGIVFGWLYANQIINKISRGNYNFSSITKKNFDDIIIYLILGIILGGRLGYVFFYNFNYYSQNLSEIFKLWNGGMSFHGGLLGVIITTFIFAKKNQINFYKLADIICCVAPIGLFFGRIANFINGELYGKITLVPWGVIFPFVDGESRHPSQIYEAFLEGIVLFLIINFIFFKRKFFLIPGKTSGIFLIIYSIFRAIIENFREPDIHLGYFFNYFSMGMMLSIITFVAGFLIIFLVKKNEQNN